MSPQPARHAALAFSIPFSTSIRRYELAVAVAFVLISAPLTAQEITFSGWGAAGAKFEDKVPLIEYNQDYYYRAKLQANLDYKDGIEAQIDLRTHSFDKRVEFREYSVRFKPWKYLRLKVGNTKRPFGLEELTSRDTYVAMDYSQPNSRFSEFGYAGRGVGLLAYYEYSEKRPELPFSYYAGLYSNNSFTMSGLLRGSYHAGGMRYSLGYAMLNRGGDNPVTGHAASADIGWVDEDFESSLEFLYGTNPDETVLRDDSAVAAFGAKWLTRYVFPIDGDFIKDIEPYLLLSYFAPDDAAFEYHTANIQLGANFYILKDVFIRLRVDGLLSKEAYNEDYETYGSSFTMEIFTRFD